MITRRCSAAELYGAFWHFLAHCFGFYRPRLHRYTVSHEASVHFLLSRKLQSDTFTDSLVNIVDYLAAEESDIFLERWRRPKTELKERCYWTYIHRETQTQLQMNASVSQCVNKKTFAAT